MEGRPPSDPLGSPSPPGASHKRDRHGFGAESGCGVRSLSGVVGVGAGWIVGAGRGGERGYLSRCRAPSESSPAGRAS